MIFNFCKVSCFLGILNLITAKNLTVEIYSTSSTNFDVRKQASKAVNLAKCVIQNCDKISREDIFFVIGQKEILASSFEINEETFFCSAILNYAPVAEDDEKWVSCEVRKASMIVKSNNCFNLDVKHRATSINLELSNIMKNHNGNATELFVVAGTRVGAKCYTDGNPREKTQLIVNKKKIKGRSFNAKKEDMLIECRSKSHSTKKSVISIFLDEPVVAQNTNSSTATICSAVGSPSPTISWMKLPQIGQRIFKMKSESTRKRQWLRKWEYKLISEKDSASLQPDEIYICKAENEFLSKSTFFRPKKIDQVESTDLVIRPEIRKRKEVQIAACANSICNVPTKKSMLVSCSKHFVEADDDEDLELILDGYILDPEISQKNISSSTEVVAEMKLPMKKEGLIRRKKSFLPEPAKKSCTHRLACCSGDSILNSVDIVQNFLNAPIIAHKRHNIYRQINRNQIRRRIGSYLDIQCYADSIPQSTIFWVKEDKKKRTRAIVGNQSFLQFSNITLEDIGIYTCISSNSLGSKEFSFKLKIH